MASASNPALPGADDFGVFMRRWGIGLSQLALMALPASGNLTKVDA